MKKSLCLFSVLALFFICGCVKLPGKDVFKGSAEKSEGAGFFRASISVVPETAYSGEPVMYSILLKNLGRRELEHVVVCVYGENIEPECKNLRFYENTEKEISFRSEAPEYPQGFTAQEKVYARIYLKDRISATLQLPVIDENEYLNRKRLGKPVKGYTFEAEDSFLETGISLEKFPVIAHDGRAEFGFTLKIANKGEGNVFDPDAFPSDFSEISDEDMGVVYVRINAPHGFDVECDREKGSEGYRMELFRGEDALYCHVELEESDLTTEKVYPVTFDISYGYYFDVSSSYVVKGKGEFVPSPAPLPEFADIRQLTPELSFDESCGAASFSKIKEVGEIKCLEEEKYEYVRENIEKCRECIRILKSGKKSPNCRHSVEWYEDAIKEGEEELRKIQKRIKEYGCYWKGKKFFVYRLNTEKPPSRIEVRYLSPAGGYVPYAASLEEISDASEIFSKPVELFHVSEEMSIEYQEESISFAPGYYAVISLPPKEGRLSIERVKVTVSCQD